MGGGQPLSSAYDASGPSSGSAGSVDSTILPSDSASNTQLDVAVLAHAVRQLPHHQRQVLIKELMTEELEPLPEELRNSATASTQKNQRGNRAPGASASAPAALRDYDPTAFSSSAAVSDEACAGSSVSAPFASYPSIGDTLLPKGLERERQRLLATNASGSESRQATTLTQFLTIDEARNTFDQEMQYAKGKLISGLDDSSFAQHNDVKNAKKTVNQHIQELYSGRSNPNKTERAQLLWQQDRQYKERGDAESDSEYYHISLACNRLKHQCTAQPLSQVVEDCGHNANKLARIAREKQRQDPDYSAFLYRLSIRENFRAFQKAEEMKDDALRTKHLYYASYGIYQLKVLLKKGVPMSPLYKQASVVAAKYYRDTAEGLSRNLMSPELHRALKLEDGAREKLKSQSVQHYEWAASEFQDLARDEADLARKVMFATLASECYVKASDAAQRVKYLRWALGMWWDLRERSSDAGAYEYKLRCVEMAIPVAEKLDSLTNERNTNQLKEQQASLQESIRLRDSANL